MTRPQPRPAAATKADHAAAIHRRRVFLAGILALRGSLTTAQAAEAVHRKFDDTRKMLDACDWFEKVPGSRARGRSHPTTWVLTDAGRAAMKDLGVEPMSTKGVEAS